jgi:hypothetical protein
MNPFVGGYANAHDDLMARMSDLSKNIGSPYPITLKATVSEVGSMIRAIGSMVESPDPDLSNDGNFAKVMKRVDEAESYTTAALNKQGEVMASWSADLQRRENIACGFDRTSDDAKGIADAFCAKPLPERIQDLMTRFLKDPKKGGMYIGIVERIDDYRSGIEPDMIARARNAYIGIHRPELADERGRITELLEAAQAAAGLTSRVKSSLSDPRRYADIRDRKAKYTAAERDFLAALSRKPDAA